MIYLNLEPYLPMIHKFYKGIACPYQNDYLASVSFTYFSSFTAIHDFIEFIPQQSQGQVLEPDMYIFGSYKNARSNQQIDHLPTLTKEFIRDSILKNKRNEVASKPWKYWNNIEWWDSIFDTDGIGAFLHDKEWSHSQAFFDTNLYNFSWEVDSENKKIPYIYEVYSKHKYRINSLHILSKQLHKYLSIDIK